MLFSKSCKLKNIKIKIVIIIVKKRDMEALHNKACLKLSCVNFLKIIHELSNMKNHIGRSIYVLRDIVFIIKAAVRHDTTIKVILPIQDLFLPPTLIIMIRYMRAYITL